jgi:branched-chain amino acid transport system substrate-binding protein
MPATRMPKGVEDYFKYVNDMKLLGDDKIDCTIRDDQYKTDVTKRNFEDFLDQGIVFTSTTPPAARWP